MGYGGSYPLEHGSHFSIEIIASGHLSSAVLSCVRLQSFCCPGLLDVLRKPELCNVHDQLGSWYKTQHPEPAKMYAHE